ncbi:MAG: ACT domain-containing protein [Chloroflexota bacterium]
MSSAARLKQALALARVVVAPEEMVLARLPRERAAQAATCASELSGFWSLTLDDAELSLVLPATAWARLAERFPEATVAPSYRLLTFDLPLALDLVGFLAAVSAALAARGVSVYALSAFSRDHILVRAADVSAAVAALESLQAEKD